MNLQDAWTFNLAGSYDFGFMKTYLGAFGKTALGRPAVVVDAMGAGDVGAASG